VQRSRMPIRRALRASAFALQVSEHLFARSDAAGDFHPDDRDHGVVGGPDPDRVLFLGEPGEMTLGVRTHELALPAFSARHLAARTGRGVAWSIARLMGSRIQHGPRIVAERALEIQKVDAVVLMAGITDVLRGTRAAVWERHMAATLDALVAHLPVGSPVLVAEIPPLSNAGSLSRLARVAAGIRGDAFDRRTRALLADRPDVHAIPFPEELTRSLWRPESEERRYTETYRVWGRHVAEAFLRVTA
jgi:lysophospholipase L1-like esterase